MTRDEKREELLSMAWDLVAEAREFGFVVTIDTKPHTLDEGGPTIGGYWLVAEVTDGRGYGLNTRPGEVAPELDYEPRDEDLDMPDPEWQP